MDDEGTNWLTVAELAELTGWSRGAIRNACREGRLGALARREPVPDGSWMWRVHPTLADPAIWDTLDRRRTKSRP